VLGGGKLSMGNIPINASPESVHQALGCCWSNLAERGAPEAITAFSLVSPFHSGQIPSCNAIAEFHKFLTFSSTFVTNFFGTRSEICSEAGKPPIPRSQQAESLGEFG
jgi:hypothetical protein